MAESFGWAVLGETTKRELATLIASGQRPAAPRLLELELATDDGRALPWLMLRDRLKALVGDGLRALRLVGQPFLHPDIDRILHLVADLDLALDDVALPPWAVTAARLAPLLDGCCHQVTVPMTSCDAADFSRLTGRPAADHAEVVRTAETILAQRSSVDRPTIVARYRFDRVNHRHLPRMFWHGRDAGCDVIALEAIRAGEPAVGEPLAEAEGEALHPLLDAILADPAAHRADLRFHYRSWRVMLAHWRRLRGVPDPLRPAQEGSAPTRDRACFFSWYAASVDADGSLHACPKLTAEPPLGSLADVPFAASPVADIRRAEQHRVLLSGGRLFFRPGRFEQLGRRCVEAGACGLKSRFFAHDGGFLEDLDHQLETAGGTTGVGARMARGLETLAYRTAHGVRARLPRPEAAATAASPTRRVRLHVGCGKERLVGWLNLDLQVVPFVDLAGDVVRGLPIRDGVAEAVYAEHFLEHLRADHALAFLAESHRVLADGCWLRLSTPNLDWVESHYRERAGGGDRRRAALELNRSFYGWGHRFLWNRELLAVAVEAAGFVDLSFRAYRETGAPRLFTAIEQHETYPDTAENPHVLIVEATKGAPDPERLAALSSEILAAVVAPAESRGMLCRDEP